MSLPIDLGGQLVTQESLVAQSLSGTVTGAACNMQGYTSAALVVSAGAFTGTNLVVKIQDCDTSGGTYADISTPITTGNITVIGTTTPVPPVNIDLRLVRQYLKAVATTTGGAVLGSAAIVGIKKMV
jgi:hypothetical protein